MRRWLSVLAFAAFGLSIVSWHRSAAEQGKDPVRKEFGLDKRVPWTTSNVKGSPEPPPPYKTEPAFPKLPRCRNMPMNLRKTKASRRNRRTRSPT